MFADEGRWRGAVKNQIEEILSDLELDELDLVLEFVKILNKKK